MERLHLARCSRAARTAAATLASLLLATASTLTAQRLPQTVHPEHYTLSLAPDLQAATFTGDETIDLNLTEATDKIALNAAEITFKTVSVSAGGKELIPSSTLDQQKDTQQVTFTFPESLPAGKATLKISYSGILNNELRGFYLSKTAKRNYAVTQFEATDARRAFPCFDEPAFKATYDVSLTIDAGDTAISNGPIVSDSPAGAGKHTLTFLTTPKMSTYLVAFLVGDFQCTSGSSDGAVIRVCATPDKVALTSYGVDVAEKMLHYYNGYFGIPYPLKKLDLIALPDFEAGAMENFGAITYRETALLIDSTTASVGAKKQVSLVIAHEMAHQWFGDLATMQWWDNLWLSEGFATWMEYKAVSRLHPEWNMGQSTILDADNTLNTDAQPTARAIRAQADTPDEINQLFDGIAYGKAGAVLGSVENYLGEETFRQGVHNYLEAHQYGNATAEDFWGAQTANSRKPVDKIMESLVAQPGVPLVTFGSPAGGKVAVSQTRFFLSPGIQPDPRQKWTLPICFKTTTGQECKVLTPESETLTVPVGFFFADAGGKGFYRSAYSPEAYKAIEAAVETRLTPEERISLLGDEWAQVRASKTSVGDYLDLVTAVKSDSNAEVLSAALEGVGAINQRAAGTADEKASLAAWVRKSFSTAYARLPAPTAGDSANTRELRAQLFGTLGYIGKDPLVLAQAREMAVKYLADPSSVDASLGQTALAVAARNGDSALFDRLQNVYETSSSPELKETALRLLAQFADPSLNTRMMDYAVSSKVRNQDAAIEFIIGLRMDESRDLTWSYIKNNWEKVKAQLTEAMGGYLVGSTGSFCSADARDDVKQFFAAHEVASSSRSLKHAIEQMDGCIEMRSLQEPKLKQWLAAQTK